MFTLLQYLIESNQRKRWYAKIAKIVYRMENDTCRMYLSENDSNQFFVQEENCFLRVETDAGKNVRVLLFTANDSFETLWRKNFDVLTDPYMDHVLRDRLLKVVRKILDNM